MSRVIFNSIIMYDNLRRRYHTISGYDTILEPNDWVINSGVGKISVNTERFNFLLAEFNPSRAVTGVLQYLPDCDILNTIRTLDDRWLTFIVKKAGSYQDDELVSRVLVGVVKVAGRDEKLLSLTGT